MYSLLSLRRLDSYLGFLSRISTTTSLVQKANYAYFALKIKKDRKLEEKQKINTRTAITFGIHFHYLVSSSKNLHMSEAYTTGSLHIGRTPQVIA